MPDQPKVLTDLDSVLIEIYTCLYEARSFPVLLTREDWDLRQGLLNHMLSVGERLGVCTRGCPDVLIFFQNEKVHPNIALYLAILCDWIETCPQLLGNIKDFKWVGKQYQSFLILQGEKKDLARIYKHILEEKSEKY